MPDTKSASDCIQAIRSSQKFADPELHRQLADHLRSNGNPLGDLIRKHLSAIRKGDHPHLGANQDIIFTDDGKDHDEFLKSTTKRFLRSYTAKMIDRHMRENEAEQSKTDPLRFSLHGLHLSFYRDRDGIAHTISFRPHVAGEGKLAFTLTHRLKEGEPGQALKELSYNKTVSPSELRDYLSKLKAHHDPIVQDMGRRAVIGLDSQLALMGHREGPASPSVHAGPAADAIGRTAEYPGKTSGQPLSDLNLPRSLVRNPIIRQGKFPNKLM